MFLFALVFYFNTNAVVTSAKRKREVVLRKGVHALKVCKKYNLANNNNKKKYSENSLFLLHGTCVQHVAKINTELQKKKNLHEHKKSKKKNAQF